MPSSTASLAAGQTGVLKVKGSEGEGERSFFLFLHSVALCRGLRPLPRVCCPEGEGLLCADAPASWTDRCSRVVVDGRQVQLQLCDMAGQDEFDRLRPLCYRDADVFLLCYSVVLPSSFRSVTDRWAPEVHRLCPGVPIILVGTQCDLQEDVQVLIRLAGVQERPVSGDEARLCARSIGAGTFTECSALTQKNLKEVFDGAILASMRRAEEPRMLTLREKTPDKIKQLSDTWWRKLSCVQSFQLQ